MVGANVKASQPRKPFVTPRLPRNTADPQSLRWVQERLKECQTSHKNCKRRTTASFAPTRLVELPPSNPKTGDKKVFLVERPAQTTPYACISHCWGDPAKMFKTTKATLPLNKKGIEIARLPKTFRDCISFARDLGVQHIWIDSICIVQDDPEDWRQEASKMCSVYENAYITIAAAKAANGSAGLFSDIHPDYQGHRVATIGGQHDVYFRRALDHTAFQYLAPDKYLSDYPLLHRGWVFQERFLSTRFLCFGESELTLECLSDTVSQCGDGALSSAPKRQDRKALHYNALGGPDHSASSFWQHMVMDYSRLALSFPGDYFPALAGLAKQWQAKQKARYVAGMWTYSLVNDLQWTVPKGRQQKRPGKWRAPSWSWAAVDTEVHYAVPPEALMDDGATVKEVKCTPLPIRGNVSDNTGELKHAFITISGLVTPATLAILKGEYALRGGPGTVREFSPDYAPVPGLEKASSMSVFLLRIGVSNLTGSFENTFSLVLRQIKASKEFERIGACTHYRQVVRGEKSTAKESIVTIL